MADNADKANELAEWQLQHNLKRHHQQTEKMVNTSPLCDECGEEIPQRRRELLPHAIRCVDCQHIVDVFNRRYRHV